MLTLIDRSPLGILAPAAKETADFFQTMADDLEANPSKFGFRGAKSYFSNGDALRGAEIMTVFYFQDQESVHKFAHSETHMTGWTWWNKTVSKHPHLGM